MDEQLKAAFVEALGIDEATTNWDGLTYRGIPEWDSVAHMQLVGEIEDSFDVMLETDDVIGMNSFTMAKQILAKYGVDLG
jgi:acyl carrier protein